MTVLKTVKIGAGDSICVTPGGLEFLSLFGLWTLRGPRSGLFWPYAALSVLAGRSLRVAQRVLFFRWVRFSRGGFRRLPRFSAGLGSSFFASVLSGRSPSIYGRVAGVLLSTRIVIVVTTSGLQAAAPLRFRPAEGPPDGC